MQTTRKRWGVTIVFVVALGAYPLQREWTLRQLTCGASENARSSRPWRNERERLAYFARKRRFANVWLSRNTKTVRPIIEAYLSDPALSLRVSGVRALGWLEQPEGLAALKKVQKRLESGQEKEVRLQTVQLAQGRIQARDLKGQKKLDVFCRSVGLSWGEVVRLSKKINAPATPQEQHAVAGSPAVEIVRETVNLLYSMGKKKQNIQPFAQQLTLARAQKFYLQVAPLPKQTEAMQIIKYAILNKINDNSDDAENLVKNHLVGLGSVERRQLLLLVEQVASAPNKFFPHPESTRGYTALFRAVANTNDLRAVKPLLLLEKHPYRWVSYYAAQSRRRLEEKSAVPDFPA